MFCAYPRPRYHVSVYRIFGPLISIYNLKSVSPGKPSYFATKQPSYPALDEVGIPAARIDLGV